MPAILSMILACFFFASMSAVAKMLVEELNGPAVVLFRNAACFLLWWPVWFWHKREIREHLWSKPIWLRVLFSQSANTMWFMALGVVALPMAMAISFSTPLFTTLCAILFLAERVSYRRWTAIILGFVGVLFILLPGNQATLDANYLWVFGAVLSWALAHTVMKKLSMSVSPTVIIFFITGQMTLFSIPLGAFYWVTPTPEQIMWVLLCAVFTIIWQWFLLKAFMQADLSMLQPFEYSKLIFASVIGYVVFEETLSLSGWIGAAIVAASGTYIAWRERKMNKDHKDQ